MTQLAHEFGYKTGYLRYDDPTRGWGTAAPGAFRKRVKALVGEKTYKKIADQRYTNVQYR
jgi:hypothetical protein